MPLVRALAIAVLLLTPLVAASPYEDEIHAWRDRPWTAETTAESRSFEHVRTATSERGTDTLAWNFDVDAMRLTGDHTAPNGTVREVLDLRVDRFVEFEDVDGDGRYSLGDTVVQTHKLDGILVRATDEEGGVSIHADARILNAGAGRLDWTFFLPTGTINTSATFVAWEFLVRDFDYESDNLTHLAMVMRLGDARLIGDRSVESKDGRIVSHTVWGTKGLLEAGATYQSYASGDGREALVALALPREHTFEVVMQNDVHQAREVGVAEQVARSILGNFWIFAATLAVTGLALYGAYRWTIRDQEEAN